MGGIFHCKEKKKPTFTLACCSADEPHPQATPDAPGALGSFCYCS